MLREERLLLSLKWTRLTVIRGWSYTDLVLLRKYLAGANRKMYRDWWF